MLIFPIYRLENLKIFFDKKNHKKKNTSGCLAFEKTLPKNIFLRKIADMIALSKSYNLSLKL